MASGTEFAFLMTASIALFTVFSIIFGYMLLQNAVQSVAEQSSYYTYVSILDTMQNSMTTDHASATKLHFAPRYVLFFAGFEKIEDIYFFEPDAPLLFDVTTKNNNCEFFNRIKAASSGIGGLWNEGLPDRKELEKCVGETCFCIAEVNNFLLLNKDYFMADTCYPMCWGTDAGMYGECLSDNPCSSDNHPVDIINACNQQVADNNEGSLCANCVNYLNDMYSEGSVFHGGSELDYDPRFGELVADSGYSGLKVIDENKYSVLVLDNDDYNSATLPNRESFELLKEFSKATKFAFASDIIECRPLSGLGGAGGSESGYCYNDNQGKYIPYLMYYLSSYDSGIFTILSTSQIINDAPQSNDVYFGIFSTVFSINSFANPDKCFWFPSTIQTEAA